MRTDVTVEKRRVKLPATCLALKSPGCFTGAGYGLVSPGDWITWQDRMHPKCQGRVIGVVKPLELVGPMIVVCCLFPEGHVAERWVAPEDVTSCHPCNCSMFRWLFADEWNDYPERDKRDADALAPWLPSIRPPDVRDEAPEPTEPDESMDGDFDTGMASAGFGTDEDYGGDCDRL